MTEQRIGRAQKILSNHVERPLTIAYSETGKRVTKRKHSFHDEFQELLDYVRQDFINLNVSEAARSGRVLHSEAMDPAEQRATRDLLIRNALPIVLKVAAQEAAQFTRIQEAFILFLEEAFRASNRWNPHKGLTWGKYAELALLARARDLIDEDKGTSQKVFEGRDLFYAAMKTLEERNEPVTARNILAEIISMREATGEKAGGHWTLAKVEMMLDADFTLSLDLVTENEDGDGRSLAETLATDPEEESEKQKLEQAATAIDTLQALPSQSGSNLYAVVTDLGEHVHDLLRAASENGGLYLDAMAATIGVDARDARQIVKVLLPIFKAA